MPEFPDVEVYLDALAVRVMNQRIEAIRLASPFLLRTVEPPVSDAVGQLVVDLRRLGKRICIGLENEVWLVFHLMVAGRFAWEDSGVSLSKRNDLAAIDFDHHSLVLTEAGSKKRASLHLVSGEQGLAQLDPGGIDFMTCGRDRFGQRLTQENHTLKRALTDPRLFSGIGNAYSDEILHHARLSPVKLTQRLGEQEIDRLYQSTCSVMQNWRDQLAQECGEGFPRKVTAFRPQMAVHGKFGEPCPECGTPVQRIVYVSNETNYCPRCQTGGKLLADRDLSRLLKKDWPRSIEQLEGLKGA